MIVVWILLGLLVLLALWGVAMYNGLIRQRNQVEEGWRQIDVELKRRHDLIPNLVETVKGYASHERGTLEEVMRARSVAMAGGQGPAQAAQTEGVLSQALGRLIAVAEAYPDLKANQNFLALQQELGSTEDRIASARRYYNALVRDLNTKVESVPTNVVAGTFGIRRAEYFETPVVESAAPSVSFGPGPAAPPVGGGSQPGAVGGSTQPGGVQGADVPWRAPGSGPMVTSGHDDAAAPLPQAQAPQDPSAPDPTVDRNTPPD